MPHHHYGEEMERKAFEVTDASYTNTTPEGFVKNKEFSDRRSKVYEDGQGNVYLSFRGTNPTNMNDLVADLHILTGTQASSKRFQEAEEKLKRVQNHYGDSKKYHVVGHSLGGSQARYLAENNKGIDSAYIYNSGSNPWYNLKDEVTRKKNNQTQIYEYTTGVDPISLGTYIPRKDTDVTRVGRREGLDPHSLDNFRDASQAPESARSKKKKKGIASRIAGGVLNFGAGLYFNAPEIKDPGHRDEVDHTTYPGVKSGPKRKKSKGWGNSFV